jgi:hypothetical protein
LTVFFPVLKGRNKCAANKEQGKKDCAEMMERVKRQLAIEIQERLWQRK